MKGKALIILVASLMAFPALAAGPAQRSQQNATPSWHWDPDVVGERYVYQHRNQTANQHQEQNMATETEQNRLQENNADKAQFKSQVNEPNGLGW